jgi:hypothetical protein
MICAAQRYGYMTYAAQRYGYMLLKDIMICSAPTWERQYDMHPMWERQYDMHPTWERQHVEIEPHEYAR